MKMQLNAVLPAAKSQRRRCPSGLPTVLERISTLAQPSRLQCL
jgi:hypothetical protein